jgi:hypothetical protein
MAWLWFKLKCGLYQLLQMRGFSDEFIEGCRASKIAQCDRTIVYQSHGSLFAARKGIRHCLEFIGVTRS